jgi:LysM repeat protein
MTLCYYGKALLLIVFKGKNLYHIYTVQQQQTLNFINHTWKAGDKYWKLSSTYYGSPKYWWIIAWYNKKPIEASLAVGDTLQIPQPLGDLLGMIG